MKLCRRKYTTIEPQLGNDPCKVIVENTVCQFGCRFMLVLNFSGHNVRILPGAFSTEESSEMRIQAFATVFLHGEKKVKISQKFGRLDHVCCSSVVHGYKIRRSFYDFQPHCCKQVLTIMGFSPNFATYLNCQYKVCIRKLFLQVCSLECVWTA